MKQYKKHDLGTYIRCFCIKVILFRKSTMNLKKKRMSIAKTIL